MVVFWVGLIVGWISMLLFVCLTGNMRSREEQVQAFQMTKKGNLGHYRIYDDRLENMETGLSMRPTP